jgi:hypothetical protein
MTIRSVRFPRLLVPLGKLTLVPLLLWVIGRHAIPGAGFGSVQPDYFFVGVALLANQAALYVFAVRMLMVLGMFGIPISSFQAQRIHLQSVFYYFALPMTVGLEISRYAKVKAVVDADVRPMALGSALLADRVIGLLAATVIAASLFPFSPLIALVQWNFPLALIPPIFLTFAAVALFFRRQIVDHIYRMLALLRASKGHLLAVLIISVLTHVFFAFGAYAGAQAFSLQISFGQALLAVSLAMLFVILPVSFAGISPVEAASFGLLMTFGVPKEEALLFAVITYFAKLIAAVEGACWEFLEGGSAFAKLLAGGAEVKSPPRTRHGD